MDSTRSTPKRQPKRSIVLPSANRFRRPRPVPVLVVLHSDGYVEVFGSDAVRPVVVNRLDSCADPLLIDEYLETQIPRSHRPIHLPRCLRGTGSLEQLTAAGEIDRLSRLQTLERIERVGA